MVIKRYNVTLEEDIVEEAKEYFTDEGGKLSPLINVLLKKWIKKKEENKNE